jgi:spore coat polysaccharide biosynthesis protein SpsF
MTSTRLPGKVLLPVLGKPLLELLIERLKRATVLDAIVLATTRNASDDVIETLAHRLGAGCFRGSEEDVLDRVRQAAHENSADVIVEVTADNPLIDPALLDTVVRTYLRNDADYVSNLLRRTYPRGMEIQVFSTAVLDRVAGLTLDPVDHEHVSLYIYEHPEIFSLLNVESGLPERYSDIRLTVDTKEDFALITKIFESLYPDNPAFTLQDIIALLDNRKDYLEINRSIVQKKVR